MSIGREFMKGFREGWNDAHNAKGRYTSQHRKQHILSEIGKAIVAGLILILLFLPLLLTG